MKTAGEIALEHRRWTPSRERVRARSASVVDRRDDVPADPVGELLPTRPSARRWRRASPGRRRPVRRRRSCLRRPFPSPRDRQPALLDQLGDLRPALAEDLARRRRPAGRRRGSRRARVATPRNVSVTSSAPSSAADDLGADVGEHPRRRLGDLVHPADRRLERLEAGCRGPRRPPSAGTPPRRGCRARRAVLPTSSARFWKSVDRRLDEQADGGGGGGGRLRPVGRERRDRAGARAPSTCP